MRVALLVLAACGSKDPPPSTNDLGSAGSSDVLKGTLIVDGKSLSLTACKPDHTVHTFVEVLTPSGKLRYEDQRLYWNREPESLQRGDRLECAKLDRSWGGGTRPDGTSYWRGTLAFTCTLDGTPITGGLTLDCGNITSTERTQLDHNRADFLDKQNAPASP